MHFNRLFTRAFLFAGVACLLINPSVCAAEASTVNSAFQVARAAVAPAVQDKVVSLYGVGTPAMINKWYIIFYDPSIKSHGRAVLVENGKITKTYDAKVSAIYSSKLTFDPAKITSEEPALSAAQSYATKHSITYDGVRALLKQTSATKPFRWRIELTKAGVSRGFVLVNAVDDTVALYVPAHAHHTNDSDSVPGDAQQFGNDVQHTFLGIGGDLQEFFTGERTVDQ